MKTSIRKDRPDVSIELNLFPLSELLCLYKKYGAENSSKDRDDVRKVFNTNGAWSGEKYRRSRTAIRYLIPQIFHFAKA
jgi:hypothetical protein